MDIQKPQPTGPGQKPPQVNNYRSEEPQPEGPEKNSSKGISFFTELVKIILLAFLIIVPIRTFVFQPFFVQGSSMEPNFHNGEYLIINELGYKRTVIAAADKEFFSVEPFRIFSAVTQSFLDILATPASILSSELLVCQARES